MMFNKTTSSSRAKKPKMERNDAGAMAYVLPDCQAMFGEGLAFTPRNSYYRTLNERLHSLEGLIKKNINDDPLWTAACAWFMGAMMGRRLTPTMMVATLAADEGNKYYVEKLVKSFFTRPDFFANCLAYYKDKQGLTSIGAIPVWFRDILKEQFETLQPHTLIAQKMLRRQIKLKDLIKVLHPKTYPDLYRAIIEDAPESKLKVVVKENGKLVTSKLTTLKAEAGKADSNISAEQVTKTISENISRWPINELLSNLSSLQASDAGKLARRLEDFFSDPSAQRLVNPFDIVKFNPHGGHRNIAGNIDDAIINVLDNTIEKFFNFTMECKRPLIMYDTSGSMHGESHVLGCRYMALLRGLMQQDFRFYSFANDDTDMTDFIKSIMNQSPLTFAKSLFERVCRMSGGTALLYSLKSILQKEEPFDGLLIITDEMTWDDYGGVQSYSEILRQNGLNGRTVLVNVAQTKSTAFKPNAEICRISGEEGKILNIANSIFAWNHFKQNMIDQFVKA